MTVDYFVGKKKPIWLFEGVAMINSIRTVRRAKGLTLEEAVSYTHLTLPTICSV